MGAVFIFEPDSFFRSLISTLLIADGFTCIPVTNLDEHLIEIEQPGVDAVIISTDQHNPSGSDICRVIRQHTACPILMIGAENAPETELIAFAAGASDYMTKPLNPRVFLARLAHHVSQQSRKIPGLGDPISHSLTYETITLDMRARTVDVEGSTMHLTRTEFEILALLMSEPHRVFTHREMLNSVWQEDWLGDERLLQSHSSRLRRKIRDRAGLDLVVANRGVGYQLTDSRAS
jgi:DNA-binding response OmpR family regulator